MRVLETLCVPLRVGDVWNIDGTDIVRIVSFSRKIEFENGCSISMDEEVGSIPWPFVRFELENISGSGVLQDYTGAPAFYRGTLLSRGTGKEWNPSADAISVRREREEKAAKEREEDDKRSRGTADPKGGYRRFGSYR
jgi:hypothetical protein